MDDLQGIRDVIDNWIKYTTTERNLDAVMKLYSENYSGIGTGENEVSMSKREVKERIRHVLSVDQFLINNLQILNTRVNGNVGWCLVTYDETIINNGETWNEKIRMSYVFEKFKQQWLISQIHFSVPQIGLEEGEGSPTRKGLKVKIEELINEYNINLNNDAATEAVMKYLEKAKELAQNLSA